MQRHKINNNTDTKRVYTIPPQHPFVDTLARGILDQVGDDPISLAKYHILLPTRRSCRSLKEAFLRHDTGTPRLLPRMSPIGDVDENELMLSDDFLSNPEQNTLSIPSAISDTRRQIILMRLILELDPKQSPDQAVLLARELSSLIDQVTTERLNFTHLKDLDVQSFANHWQKTLKFLDLLTEHWPDILLNEGSIDPADRRNRLLEAQANFWKRKPPHTPVIAAGSTGSIPATADLLKVVSSLPKGAVVLPGLDKELTDDAWGALGPTHPQFGIKHLLNHLDIERELVDVWEASPIPNYLTAPASRPKILRQALLPGSIEIGAIKDTTVSHDTFSNIERVDCQDSRKEAQAIAIAIRETLEIPLKTAALVTPDRELARRVATELSRWGIEVDDSAGIPLAHTSPGIFLGLTAEVMANDMAPVPLLAMLKHPLTACGKDPIACRREVHKLELAILRGVRPKSGISGLQESLENVPENASTKQFIQQLKKIASPFLEILDTREVPLAEILKCHVDASELLAGCEEREGAQRLWDGEAGEALAIFVSGLHDALDESIIVTGAEYARLLKTLMIGHVVRPKYNRHPRVQIWGPMEARLQHADTLILGGLNEGTWPPQVDANPWMSRPMMKAFGLPLPEQRIGLSAHDFAQSFAAPRVILTRAKRVDGVPTVASRWIRRLDNFIDSEDNLHPLRSNPRLLELALVLEKPIQTIQPSPPRPCPPTEARPRKISVTRVRDLQRDPYAVYARQILNLKPLEPIDADPSAANRGTLIHNALEIFLRAYPKDLPQDAEERLLIIGRETFGEYMNRPGIYAFWWPRFERIAKWFVLDELKRREAREQPILIEQLGKVSFDAPGGNFTLTAKVDRVDLLPTGGLGIIDYKTGTPPSAKQVRTMLEPQLPLESAMIAKGCFNDLPTKVTQRLSYIKLNGGQVPGMVSHLDLNVEKVTQDTWNGFQKLISDFDNPDTPYLSRTRPMKQREVGDFDHLARIGEWMGVKEDE